MPLISQPIPIFLTVMAIILLAPLLLGRLKIPNVISLIIAGVAVGPHGFNLLDRDMSFEIFGQVGLFYLMFLAGIEIDMYHLKKNLTKGLVFGAYTFLIPLVAGAAAAMICFGMSLLTGALLGSVFAAHTLIAYPIVSRFGLTKTPPVVIAIAGTIVAVLGSLIVLAGVLGVEREGSISSLFPILGALIAFCIGIIYIYPRITRWFFKNYREPVPQFIYVLVMVFLSAATAKWIGLEGVFGAFFAGLVLNRYIPARSPLMGRLEFVGNAIFIPYFLIGVGMLIDLHVVVAGWSTLYVAGVMTVIAMATKWLAALATQKTFGMDRLARSIIFQLSNAHTAVALAVVTIGYSMNLLSVEILNGTVIMILITCTVSSLGTESAATRMRLRIIEATDDDTTRRESPVPRTLVSVANPLTAPGLVDLAILSRDPSLSGPETQLCALHVRTDNSSSSREIGRRTLELAEKAAAAVENTLTPIERVDNNFIDGVVNTMAERDISEVFIGLHRRVGVIDTFMGDKIEQLLIATDRMVVITRLFIPVNTVTRIIVTVPPKAQYETGFRRWVEAVGNIGRQLGCRVIFHCSPDAAPLITTVLHRARIELRVEFETMETYDDFVIQSREVLDDDLFIVVSARRSSLSFSSDMDSIPAFLHRYFSRHNIIILYPEQFGTEPTLTIADTMLADTVTTPGRLWIRAKEVMRGLDRMRRRLLGHSLPRSRRGRPDEE
ncbi:MAG: cation:proton antiporter [Duncaniella sp.]|nr:cation:proton antiporter [Duncaniella sp.]